jgi:hypothetical protein
MMFPAFIGVLMKKCRNVLGRPTGGVFPFPSPGGRRARKTALQKTVKEFPEISFQGCFLVAPFSGGM